MIKIFPKNINLHKSQLQLISGLEFQMIPRIMNVLSLMAVTNIKDFDNILQEEIDDKQYYISHRRIMKQVEEILKNYQEELM